MVTNATLIGNLVLWADRAGQLRPMLNTLAAGLYCDGGEPGGTCPIGRTREHYDRDTGRMECDECPGGRP